MTASAKPDNSLASFGSLLHTTWTLYKNNIELIFGYTAWLLVPFIITLLFSLAFSDEIFGIAKTIANAILLVLIIWISIILIKLTSLLKQKKQIKHSDINAQSSKLLFVFFLTSLLTDALTLLGLLIFIIPGIVALGWFLFSPIIVVLEHSDIIQSLKQSKTIVKGRFWQIISTYFVGEIILIALYLGILLTVYFCFSLFQGINLLTILNTPPTLLGQSIELIISIVFFPAFIIFETLFYLNVKATA